MTTVKRRGSAAQPEPDCLLKALARFQAAVEPIYKTAKGQHSTYTDLHTLLSTITPPLHGNGLVLYHELKGNMLVTRLQYPKTNEEILCEVPLIQPEGSKNPLHAWGAAVTYQRRYSIQALLGLSSQDDDGAQAGHRMTRSAKPNDGFF